MFEIIDVSERKGNKFSNLTGQKFGRLTVLGLSPKKSGRKSYWVCQCSCGNKTVVRSDILKNGSTMSCGCLKKEQDEKNLDHTRKYGDEITHESRLYQIWQGMRYRCENPNDRSYPRWGGRGIKVCHEWSTDYAKFKEWALSHGYHSDLSIDRIDVNGNYEPSNCRWANAKTQCNNRTTTIKVPYHGEVHSLTEWAEALGFKVNTIITRYHHGDRGERLFRPLENKH